jgi:H+/Cl- antiporter ClcA
MMLSPWAYCIAGILFCLIGLYSFYKDMYKERNLLWPILLLIFGVILIGVGTYTYFQIHPQ